MVQQPKPEKKPIDQMLKLVDKLTPEELAELRSKLDAKAWGEEWRQLIKDVNKDNKGQPNLSDKEILAEVKAVRKEMKAERAQKSSH